MKKNWRKSRRLFLTAIATGSMLNPLNSSMIALALFGIQKHFDLPYETVAWLISSFYLASAVAQPVTGKLGDIIGRKKMFLGGLVLVSISALGAPFASTFSFLVIMRVLQAIGSSSVTPSGLGMVRHHIKDETGSALAFISVIMTTMAALGPTIGGFLINWADWSAIFLANIPVLLLSFILGWFVLPKDEKKLKLTFKQVISKMDILGIVLFTIGIIELLLFLLSFNNSINYGAGIIGVIFLLIFGRHELKTKTPFIDIRLFKSNKKLTLVYLQFFILNFINYCLFFGLPNYFQEGLHLSVGYTGLLMLFVTGSGIILSPFVGYWVDKVGVNKPIIFGNAMLVIGAVFLLFFFENIPVLLMGLIISIIGMGCSFGNVTLQTSMMLVSPKEIIGTTTGIFQMCRYFGSIFSTIVLSIVFGDRFFSENFTTLILILLVAGIIMVFLGIRHSKTDTILTSKS